MTNGLDAFKVLLKEYRGLSVWSIGSGLAVPFAAKLADLSPPWPSGIVPVTAVVELLALALTFQLLQASTRRRVINSLLLVNVTIFVVAGMAYLVALSLFTYQVPTTNERFVKGYECTREAEAVFKNRCPDLGLDELQTAEYEAERLWTRKSITITRAGIVFLWSLVFASLSVGLGAFLFYQMRPKRRRAPA